jgi:hypothetical protein
MDGRPVFAVELGDGDAVRQTGRQVVDSDVAGPQRGEPGFRRGPPGPDREPPAGIIHGEGHGEELVFVPLVLRELD